MSGSFTKFGPEPVETSNESQAADKNYQINNQINHNINNQFNNQINNQIINQIDNAAAEIQSRTLDSVQAFLHANYSQQNTLELQEWFLPSFIHYSQAWVWWNGVFSSEKVVRSVLL